MDQKEIKPEAIPMGVVGLGLMGSSICVCLLMAGHPVVAVAPLSVDLEQARPRMLRHVEYARQHNMIRQSPEELMRNLVITGDYSILAPCKIALECTMEDISIKKSACEKIEPHIAEE